MAAAELFTVLDLGSSMFRLRHSGLTVTSSVSTKLIIPENCAFLLHCERLGEILKSRACWVTPAPELALHAHVQRNGDSQSHASSYLKLVSEILQYEKAWTNLGLAVTMKNCGYMPGFDSATEFSVSFDIEENHLNTAKWHLPHKLLGLFSADAPPPPAILRVSLSEVRVSLSFHRSNRKYNMATIRPSVVEMDSRDLCVVQPRPGLPCHEVLRDCIIREYNSSLPHITSDIRPVPFQLQFESLGRHLVSSGTQPQYYSAGYNSQEHGLSCSEDSTGFYKLLGACFDDIFVSTRSKHASGIERTNEGTTYKLSDIIPTVFSPGYREAMQQRVCLIPVIAKAMSSMIEGSHTLVSSHKLCSLQEYYTSLQGPGSDIDGSSNTMSILKDLLWRSAQKGLHRVKSTRKMWGFSSVRRRSSSSFEDMLADDDSILADDINSDDSLLDNEECEDNDSMCMLEGDSCSLTLEDSIGYEEDSVDILEMCEDYGSGDEVYEHHGGISVFSNRAKETGNAYGNCSSISDILDHDDQIFSSQLPISRPLSPSSFDHSLLPLSDIKQDLDMFHANEFESASSIEDDMMALDKLHMLNTAYGGDIDEDIIYY